MAGLYRDPFGPDAMEINPRFHHKDTALMRRINEDFCKRELDDRYLVISPADPSFPGLTIRLGYDPRQADFRLGYAALSSFNGGIKSNPIIKKGLRYPKMNIQWSIDDGESWHNFSSTSPSRKIDRGNMEELDSFRAATKLINDAGERERLLDLLSILESHITCPSIDIKVPQGGRLLLRGQNKSVFGLRISSVDRHNLGLGNIGGISTKGDPSSPGVIDTPIETTHGDNADSPYESNNYPSRPYFIACGRLEALLDYIDIDSVDPGPFAFGPLFDGARYLVAAPKIGSCTNPGTYALMFAGAENLTTIYTAFDLVTWKQSQFASTIFWIAPERTSAWLKAQIRSGLNLYDNLIDGGLEGGKNPSGAVNNTEGSGRKPKVDQDRLQRILYVPFSKNQAAVKKTLQPSPNTYWPDGSLEFIADQEFLLDRIEQLESYVSDKANTADLAAVATSGSYNDLSDKPATLEDKALFVRLKIADLKAPRYGDLTDGYCADSGSPLNYNASIINDMVAAVSGNDTIGYSVDLSMIHIAAGQIGLTQLTLYVLQAQHKVSTTWDPSAVVDNAESTDKICIALYNSTKNAWTVGLDIADRSAGAAQLEYPTEWEGDTIYSYYFFRRGTATSNSEFKNFFVA